MAEELKINRDQKDPGKGPGWGRERAGWQWRWGKERKRRGGRRRGETTQGAGGAESEPGLRAGTGEGERVLERRLVHCTDMRLSFQMVTQAGRRLRAISALCP